MKPQAVGSDIEAWCPTCGKTVIAAREKLGDLVVCANCEHECYIPSERIQPGTRFGDYEVIRPLGVGATAEVHLAQDPHSGDQVAVKILFTDRIEQEVDLQRFLREARTATELDHPGIIKIHDTGAMEHCYYLAMEYVDGEPLDQLLSKYGALTEPDVLNIAHDVALALQYAWQEKKILHRDIKPANIMLAYDGRAKLMDLGIAKSLLPDVTQLTDPDTILGTPFYMSPEQCAPGRPIDFRSDMYSLGATMYHLLTDRPPFLAEQAMEVIRKHLFAPVQNPQLLNGDVSEQCARLVMRMLAKRSKDRYNTWQDLLDDLDQLIATI